MVHAAPLLQHGLVAAVLEGLAVDLELALPAVRLEVRARLLDHRARCACLLERGARRGHDLLARRRGTCSAPQRVLYHGIQVGKVQSQVPIVRFFHLASFNLRGGARSEGVDEVLEKARIGHCAQGVHESAQGRQIWEFWE